MFQSRLSRIVILLVVVCAVIGGGVTYLGRAQPPETVSIHHVLAAPEQKASAGNVVLPDVLPRAR